jgi:hypothetical protein
VDIPQTVRSAGAENTRSNDQIDASLTRRANSGLNPHKTNEDCNGESKDAIEQT